MITISLSHKPLTHHHVQGYVVPLEQGFVFDKHIVSDLTRYYAPLKELIDQRKFTGALNSTCTVAGVDGSHPVYIILVGMGSARERQADRLEHYRRAVGNAMRASESIGITKLAFFMPDPGWCGVSAEVLAQETVAVMQMATYHFDEFITDESRKLSRDYDVTLCIREEYEDQVRVGSEFGQRVGYAVNQARYWCDLPPVVLTPVRLAEHAQRIAQVHNLGCTVFTEKQIIDMGMGGIHAVTKGSEQEARFVILEYKTEHKDAPTVALVGKGITFDSGGLSIKPASGMETMKDDMAGAAAVISTMEALAHLKPAVNVIALAPITENLISGHATKPGDIIQFYNGKTAEVKNTDAEGRLILADAMSYAIKHYKPDAMVTIATLTGSCAYALGPFFAGLMSQHDDVAEKLRSAGEESGDRLWPLPFHNDYKVAIRCDVADICNIGSDKYRAGAITAGFFLQNFSGETPWVHLDIAGTAFNVPDRSYYRPGATGFGVRLFIELLMNW